MKDKVAATKAERQKNKMLEIMGYDDSKKDAAYNALIDASQIIGAAPGGKSLDISKDIIHTSLSLQQVNNSTNLKTLKKQ